MASFRIEAILSEPNFKKTNDVTTSERDPHDDEVKRCFIGKHDVTMNGTTANHEREDTGDVCVDDVSSCSDCDEHDDVSASNTDNDDVTHPVLNNGQHPAFRFNPLLDQRHLSHLQALAGGAQVPQVLLNSAFRSPQLELAQRQAWMQRMHVEWLMARGIAQNHPNTTDIHSKHLLQLRLYNTTLFDNTYYLVRGRRLKGGTLPTLMMQMCYFRFIFQWPVKRHFRRTFVERAFSQFRHAIMGVLLYKLIHCRLAFTKIHSLNNVSDIEFEILL